MSASEQARVKLSQSISVFDLVASKRHSSEGARSKATHASLEQSL
jgi:hypothetical protein